MPIDAEPSPTQAHWSAHSPAHVVLTVERSEPIVESLSPQQARRLAAQLLDAAEAAEEHMSAELPRGLAHRAAALRALRELLEAGQRLAILYGAERGEAKRIKSIDGLTTRFTELARWRTP